MNRHMLTYGRPKKWYRKNDERQNKACQKSKKRQSKSLLLVRLSKKTFERLGKMGLGEMLPNPTTHGTSRSAQYLAAAATAIRELRDKSG